MRNTILVILVTLLTACSGEGFEAADAASGGDAGEATVTAAGGSATAGTSSTGGTTARQSTGGSSSNGGQPTTGGVAAGGTAATAGTTAAGGSAPTACEFDVADLTAMLPSQLAWSDFSISSGNLCVTCRDNPCGAIKILSWGTPKVLEDGRIQYLPSTDQPMVEINYGAADMACAKRRECGVKATNPTVIFEITNGQITSVQVGVSFTSNSCADAAASPDVPMGATLPMGEDLAKETAASLKALKIPCK